MLAMGKRLRPKDVALVFARSYWHEGTPAEKLYEAEAAARRRSKLRRDYINPKRERRVERVARAIREEEEKRRR